MNKISFVLILVILITFLINCDGGEGYNPPVICNQGDKQCDSNTILQCNDDGTQWITSESCVTSCSNGECTQPVCTPDERRCSDQNEVEQCNDNGTLYIVLYKCPTTCSEGNCVDALCAPFSTRCNDKTVEVCNSTGTEWQESEQCPVACFLGSCSSIDPGSCTDPGSYRCYGDILQVCNDSSAWETETICEQTCINGECTTCIPGDQRCTDDNKVEVCNEDGSGFITDENCETACLNGQCTSCNPGDRTCTQNYVEVCASDGNGYVITSVCPTTCENGSCTEPVCVPYTTQCDDDNNVEICSVNGVEWNFVENCEYGCNNGRCNDEQNCTPDTNRCNGNRLETCSDSGGWEIVQMCPEACLNEQCVPCVPLERRCNGNNIEECSQDGMDYTTVENCTTSCYEGQCTNCVPGQLSCNDSNLEVCNSTGQYFMFLTVCPTTCENNECTDPICVPYTTQCDDNIVQMCSVNGVEWQDIQTCSEGCSSGKCNEGEEIICTPGVKRCNNLDVEICNGIGTGWIYYQSCYYDCSLGECIEGGCTPFTVTPYSSSLPADGASTTLIVTETMADAEGNIIPDGTLITVSSDNGTILTQDADDQVPGTQVRSVAGRVDFVLRAPNQYGTANIDIQNPLNITCSGTAAVTFTQSGAKNFAEDFTTTNYRDEVTTATWNTSYGLIYTNSSSYFGTERDGDLVIENGETYNINSNSNPPRVFPDAISYNVTAAGENYVDTGTVILGIESGDEVILIQLQGGGSMTESQVGVYEFLTVDEVITSSGRILFTGNISKSYNTSGKIVVQRVPHYSEVVVSGTLTADAWNGAGRGLLVFRARSLLVNLSGKIDMEGNGYRGSGDCGTTAAYPGEGFLGTICSATYTQNNGGGGGSDTNSVEASYAAGGGYGTKGINGYGRLHSGTGGNSYGINTLEKLLLGAGGGSLYTSYAGGYFSRGGNGGGIIFISVDSLSVSGTISANGDNGINNLSYWYGGGGAGGTVYLQANGMSIGTSRVSAQRGCSGAGCTTGATYGNGGDGRIRLDYVSLLGSNSTTPSYYDGGTSSGDTMQTIRISNINITSNIINATINYVLVDGDRNNLEYYLSNNAGSTFTRVYPNAAFTFPTQGLDMRLRIIFPSVSGRNKLLGISISYNVQ